MTTDLNSGGSLGPPHIAHEAAPTHQETARPQEPLSWYRSQRTFWKEHNTEPGPSLPGASLTSADPLLLPGEDAWCVNDADAL